VNWKGERIKFGRQMAKSARLPFWPAALHLERQFPRSSAKFLSESLGSPGGQNRSFKALAAHSQIGASAKNSLPKPATFLSEIVQYWTAIYPKLPDHLCRT
jgi:hypothetical protein